MKINFKHFQGLEIGLLKFKGFEGFSGRIRTLYFTSRVPPLYIKRTAKNNANDALDLADINTLACLFSLHVIAEKNIIH